MILGWRVGRVWNLNIFNDLALRRFDCEDVR